MRKWVAQAMGMSEMLVGTDLNKEQSEYVGIITRSGKTLVDILDRVLNYSKLDSGEVIMEATNINIRSLLDECHAIFYFQSSESGIPINVHVDSGVPIIIMADSVLLKQIMINLLSNALKFTKAGNISIIASILHKVDSHFLNINVTDSGIGIPQDKIEHIFNVFTQAESSTSREFGGTGLGLAISKKLVEVMGGEISVDSEMGKGSTFSFTIKIGLPDSKTISNEKNSYTGSETQPLSIDIQGMNTLSALVVDDNIVNQMVLCGLLKKLEINAEKVNSGKQAVETIIASEIDFDIIFMDCEMPEMDGFEATQEIINLYTSPPFLKRKQPKIYAVSAHNKSRREKKALSSGMKGYLEKPLNLSELRELIVNIVN